MYPLNIGQPDIPSPVPFFEGMAAYAEEVLAYDPSKGNERLCASWSGYMNRTLGLSTRPEEFLITVGASEALIFVFMTCCDPGDEIIIFDPTYANYIGFAAVAGVKLVPIPCRIEENFRLPPADVVAAKVTPRTRAVLLCSPNNPTGTVYSREELEMLLGVCNEKNVFLIVDETYREFVYDGAEPLSVLHLEPRNDRVIIVDSLSKRFSLCGARVGCLVTSNEQVMATTLNLAQARLAGPTMEQFAAAKLLDNIGEDYVAGVRSEYENRRDALYEALSSVPGATAHKPQGAFYTVVRLPVRRAESFCSFLLSEFSHGGATTFLAPASGFYMTESTGLDMVRMACVIDGKAIGRAIEVVRYGLERYLKLEGGAD